MITQEERSMWIKFLLERQMQGGNAWGGRPARRLRAGSGTGCLAVARQRKDEPGAAEIGVLGQVPVAADILLAFEQIGEDVANDAGGGLELPKLLAVLDADGLQVAFQRAVEHDV